MISMSQEHTSVELSIILLNYRQCGLVKQCLRGIMQAKIDLPYEVIVVDNDSRDGCASLIRSQFPDVTLIEAPANLGFSGGNNLGINHAKGRFVLVLNDDVAITPGSIPQLVKFLQQHPNVGMVGPRLVYPNGQLQYSCRRFPTPLMPLYRRIPLGGLPAARRALAHYLMLDVDHRRDGPVDWLFGACLLIRRETLAQVGLLDGRFFLYFEDLDLCRRCWAAGWQVWYLPSVELVHYHAQSSAEGSLVTAVTNPSVRHHLASWVRYLRKYHGQALPEVSANVHPKPMSPRQA